MKEYEFIGFSTELSTFLSSCTVKWSGVADLINNILKADGYTIPDDLREWKYYLNLAGEYHSTDTRMTVMSLDTHTEIEFTRSVLTKHPLTLAAYRAGADYYVALLEKYPNNSDLIRCIVYPLDMTIDDVIAAQDFELLAYGSDILGSYELQPAISTIRKNLDYIKYHVYREVLSFDAYYPHTFWACMWLSLMSALYAMRTENVKTSYVHDYYLWEYLKSYGISDYSDVLTRQQAEWLARNINYIKMNQGTQHVLLLLANNLLSYAGMALIARVIYHHTYNNPDLLWQGEFVSDTLPTDYADIVDTSSVDTMTTMTTRLYTAGYDKEYSAEHIADQSAIIDSTPNNVLPTKIIELRPLSMFKRYANVMARFLSDSLYRTMADGKYVPAYEATDYTSAVTIKLTGVDILHLITYCSLKSVGQTPVHVPEYYRPLLGTKVYSPPDLDSYIPVSGHMMSLDYLIDTDALLGSAWYGNNTIYRKPTMYSNKISSMFIDVITMIMTYQFNSQPWEKVGILYLRSKMLDSSTVILPAATSPKLYADWLEETGLTSLVLSYDSKSDARALYDELASQLFTYILPNTAIMNKYLLDTNRTATYSKLINLMKELCSYNVLFLNGDSTIQHWIGYNPDDLFAQKKRIKHGMTLDGVPGIGTDQIKQTRISRLHTVGATVDADMIKLTSTKHADGISDITIDRIHHTRSTAASLAAGAHIDTTVITRTVRAHYPSMKLEILE